MSVYRGYHCRLPLAAFFPDAHRYEPGKASPYPALSLLLAPVRGSMLPLLPQCFACPPIPISRPYEAWISCPQKHWPWIALDDWICSTPVWVSFGGWQKRRSGNRSPPPTQIQLLAARQIERRISSNIKAPRQLLSSLHHALWSAGRERRSLLCARFSRCERHSPGSATGQLRLDWLRPLCITSLRWWQ